MTQYQEYQITMDEFGQWTQQPIKKEIKDVKCECGSDTAGSPYHSKWCPKDEKGPASKQAPPEDML